MVVPLVRASMVNAFVTKESQMAKTGQAVVAARNSRIKTLVAENKALQAAGRRIKSVATKENGQLLAVAAIAAGAGTIAGYKGQAAINAKASLPAMAKSVAKVPSLTIAGAIVTGVAIVKLKGTAQAAVAGLGAGLAGGAYLQGPPV